jgi:hypothetical protein
MKFLAVRASGIGTGRSKSDVSNPCCQTVSSAPPRWLRTWLTVEPGTQPALELPVEFAAHAVAECAVEATRKRI